MNTGFHLVNRSGENNTFTNEDREANRAVLREGVAGIELLHVVDGSDPITPKLFNDEQLTEMARVDVLLMKLNGPKIGTVEIYANGAMNVYIRVDGEVVGYVTIRP